MKLPARAFGGFTLAEVMIAIALAAVVILALGALGLSAIRSSRKSTDTVLGQMVVQKEVERFVYDAQNNPTSAVWTSGSATPLLDNKTLSSNIEFHVMVNVTDVDPASFPAPHRFRCIKGVATWWGGDNGPRQGMGQLRAETSAYVHEP